MTWPELIEASRFGGLLPRNMVNTVNRRVPASVAQKILRAAFTTIADKAMHGQRVVVPGFGVFYPAKRKARVVRNPVTKELMQLPELHSVGFRTSKAVRR